MISSCSGLFVCTAILCLDFKYSFINVTKCTPKPIYFRPNQLLLALNNRSLKIRNENLNNGFICSDCSRMNILEYHFNTSNQCYKQPTRIQLKNFCFYRLKSSPCQCFPSNQTIEPITDWIKALIKPRKDLINTNRVNNINESASSSVYILVGSILLIVLIGGIIGMMFYWIKLKSRRLK